SNSTHEPHSFSTLPRHHAYAGAWGRGGRRAVTLGDTRTLHGPRRRLRRVPGRRFDSVLAASSQRDTWDTGDIWDTWDTLPAPESSTMPVRSVRRFRSHAPHRPGSRPSARRAGCAVCRPVGVLRSGPPDRPSVGCRVAGAG